MENTKRNYAGQTTASENCTSLNHSGAPSLSYYGRAQVWCRAAIHGKTQFHEGSELIQKNAYYASRYTEENGREVVQNLHRRLVNPLKISEGNLPDTAASAMGRLAREGESPSIDPKFPWPSIKGKLIEKSWVILTMAS